MRPLRNNHGDTSVSAATFAELVRKCGLSKKRLHQQLYPMEQGRSSPTDEFPIAVATSGGADSMALMLLLREYLQTNRIKTPLLAVTVDHQLRLESSSEAQEVAKICAKHGGIKHATKRRGAEAKELLRPVKPRDSKMEEEARRYRYGLLQQVCREYSVRCLFVAHNRGDQLETTLFRLGRASGINGLAGIANQLPFFSLDASPGQPDAENTDQLMATCDRFQQTWIHDPSNDDPVYDRVRIRQELKRVEREQGPDMLDLFSRFQQTAEKAKKEFARVEQIMLREYTVTWEQDIVVIRTTVFHDPDMFDELLYRLLSIVIVYIGNKETPPRLASVSRLAAELQQLETGKQITLGGCRIKRVAKGRQLEFQPERKKR
uniref:tRNA(Ile)-lysidine synthetase n=1 Tax=Phytophthora ramorum TaxID=164328 RepID=H3HED4_PHYRM